MSSPAETSTATRVITIKPPSGWLKLDLAELWEYRELLYFLIWRDLKVRYRQTVIGVSWVVLQPLATTAIFAVIFGRLAGLPSEGIPYPLFIFAALLPWQMFSGAISRAAVSLVHQREPAHESVLPPIAGAAGRRPVGPGRPLGLPRHPRGDDGLVSHNARLGGALDSAVGGARGARCGGNRYLAGGAQREVP